VAQDKFHNPTFIPLESRQNENLFLEKGIPRRTAEAAVENCIRCGKTFIRGEQPFLRFTPTHTCGAKGTHPFAITTKFVFEKSGVRLVSSQGGLLQKIVLVTSSAKFTSALSETYPFAAANRHVHSTRLLLCDCYGIFQDNAELRYSTGSYEVGRC
jgi:hypothetical protein